MPRPTDEQVMADLQGLTPEQQRQYMDELERMFPSLPEPTHPGAPPTPQALPKPPELSGGQEFLGGMRETVLPDLETLKRMGAAAVNPLGGIVDPGAEDKFDISRSNLQALWEPLLKGMYEAHKSEFEKAGSKGMDAMRGDTLAAPEAAGHILAGLLPGVGPAAAKAGETIGRGEIDRGLGQGAGLVLPFGVAPVVKAGTAEATAASLEHKAGKALARAVGAKETEVPSVIRNAEEISKGIGITGSREKMLEKVKGTGALAKSEGAHDPASLLGKAEARLEAIKQAGGEIPVDLQNVIDEIRSRPSRIVHPEDAPFNAAETVNPEEIAAYEDWARRLENQTKAFGRVTQEAVPGEERWNVTTQKWEPTTGTPAEIEPGPVPAGEVFKMRTQAGNAARLQGGYKNNPRTAPSPGGEAAAATQGTLAEALHDAVPGLKKADLDYSTWRQVGDALEAAARKESLKPASALKIVGLKSLGMAGAGALVGQAGIGAAAGGVYGAFQVAKELLNSPLWQTASAARRLKIARFIRAGGLVTTEAAGKAGVAGSTAASRYTREGEEE